MSEYNETRLSVKIYPGSHKNEVLDLRNDVLRVRISASPEKGKANKELVDFLSDRLGITKDRIGIIRGETSRNKVISVAGLTLKQIMERLLPSGS